MSSFEEVFKEQLTYILREFQIPSGEYYCLERAFYIFYNEGRNSMKQDCTNILKDKLDKSNDSVPRTFYPSEKYKSALKTIESISV